MKRVLTILICLVLMLSIMPIEALALSSSEISSLEKYFRNSSVNIEYGLVNGIGSIIAGEYDLLTVMIYNRNGETLNDATVSLDLPAGSCEKTICCTAVVSSMQRIKDRITVIIIGEELGY